MNNYVILRYDVLNNTEKKNNNNINIRGWWWYFYLLPTDSHSRQGMRKKKIIKYTVLMIKVAKYVTFSFVYGKDELISKLCTNN